MSFVSRRPNKDVWPLNMGVVAHARQPHNCELNTIFLHKYGPHVYVTQCVLFVSVCVFWSVSEQAANVDKHVFAKAKKAHMVVVFFVLLLVEAQPDWEEEPVNRLEICDN